MNYRQLGKTDPSDSRRNVNGWNNHTTDGETIEIPIDFSKLGLVKRSFFEDIGKGLYGAAKHVMTTPLNYPLKAYSDVTGMKSDGMWGSYASPLTAGLVSSGIGLGIGRLAAPYVSNYFKNMDPNNEWYVDPNTAYYTTMGLGALAANIPHMPTMVNRHNNYGWSGWLPRNGR